MHVWGMFWFAVLSLSIQRRNDCMTTDKAKRGNGFLCANILHFTFVIYSVKISKAFTIEQKSKFSSPPLAHCHKVVI